MMLKSHKLNISFYVHRTNVLYCQVLLGGTKHIFSTRLKTNKEEYNLGKAFGKNKTKLLKETNKIKNSLEQCYEYLLAKEYPKIPVMTAKEVVLLYLGKSEMLKPEKEKSIIDVLWERAEDKLQSKIIKPQTYKHYKHRIVKVASYFEGIGKSYITYSEFNYNLFQALIYWLRDTSFRNAKESVKTKKNTYLKKFAQLISEGNAYALRKGYTKNVLPDFERFKNDGRETQYLMPQELKSLENLYLSQHLDKELDKVRDLFLFMSYTGFLWSDCLAFNPKEHILEQNGVETIAKPREKTGNLQLIPMFPKTKAILEKYQYQLPIGVEQVYNRKIKEICKIIGIMNADTITMRSGRRTAGMVWINLGIPLEVVSKMLGHKNILITQKYYAKILNERVLEVTAFLTKGSQEVPPISNIQQENILNSLAELVAQKLKKE